MQENIKAAVVGATGYSGFELTCLLRKHSGVSSTTLFTRNEGSPTTLDQAYPQIMNGRPIPVLPFSWDAIAQAQVNLLFLATPHETSWELVPEALERGIKVVDLSGAWRLKEKSNREVYGLTENGATEKTMFRSVYGSPELNALQIREADLVANPGCYATSIILALAPLVKNNLLDESAGIVCDSKSGASGAGKQPSAKTHFVQVSENLSAYSVFAHRHTGEILEQLGIANERLVFTPHLLPIPRGILSTIYVRLAKKMGPSDIEAQFRSFYLAAPCVRIFPNPSLPQIQHSLRTNYCDIGFALAPDGKRMVIVSCLDNLIKGAAGQAVQNMNLMHGWAEQEGLA